MSKLSMCVLGACNGLSCHAGCILPLFPVFTIHHDPEQDEWVTVEQTSCNSYQQPWRVH